MPRFDATGPTGMGPGTGRGFGPCGLGLGWRSKFGASRGMGRYFAWNWPITKDEQQEALLEYKKALREELDDVDVELEDLGKKS